MDSDMVCLCDTEDPTEYLNQLKIKYLQKTQHLEQEQRALEQKILQVEGFLIKESTSADPFSSVSGREVPKVFPKYQDTPTREIEANKIPKIIKEDRAEPCGLFQKFKSMLSISKCTNPDINDPPSRENERNNQASGPLTSQYGTKSVSVNHDDVSISSSLVCNCDESDGGTSRDISESGTSCLTCVGSESRTKDKISSKTQTRNLYEVQVQFSNKEFSKTSHSQTGQSTDKKSPDDDVKLVQCESWFVDDRELGKDIFSSPISIETKVGPDVELKRTCSANKARDDANRAREEMENQKQPKGRCGALDCPWETKNTMEKSPRKMLSEKVSSNRNLEKIPIKRTQSEQVGTQNIPQIDTSTNCICPSSKNADIQVSTANKTKGVDPPDSGKLENKSVPSCNIRSCPSKTRSAQCAFVGSPMLRPKDFEQATGDNTVEKEIEKERPKTPQRSKSCDCGTTATARENQMFCSKNAASLTNQAIDNMKHITELAAKEKLLQEQITSLKEKEKSYTQTSKNARVVLNQSSCICEPNLSATRKTTTDLENEIKKVSNDLKIENNILKSELMDMKLQLKHTLENIEGPLTQKLEIEKMKCECLQDDLNEASKNLILSQDSYQREMNCLKMQLCIACTNISNLNQVNERLKNEMKQLDSLCDKLEDDLMKQKLNEADTIKRLTSRKTYGAGEGPSNVEFKCPSDLENITRQLSKTLKEAPCGECTNIPKELRGAAKCIKDLADMVLSSKKIEESANCICKTTASKSDFQEPKRFNCACQSMSDIPEEIECDCECCCGGDSKPQSIKRSTDEKTVRTLHPAPADFAEKGKSSTFNVDDEQSKFFSVTSQQPCADIGIPCLKGTEIRTAETVPAPCDEIGRPCSKAVETQFEDTPKPCDDIGRPCDEDKTITKKTDKECTAPCSKDQETLTDKEKDKSKVSESGAEIVKNAVTEILDNLPVKEGTVTLAKLTEDIEQPKKVQITTSLPFEEQRFGEFPFEVTTKVKAIDEPPQELHVTTTITGSGTLEVITEGPEGTIETTLTYTDDGNIEVVTEVVDYKEQKLEDKEATLSKESSKMPPALEDLKERIIPGDKLKSLTINSSMFSGPSPAETPFSESQATPTELTSYISNISQAGYVGGTSTLTGSADGTKPTERSDRKLFEEGDSESRPETDLQISLEKESPVNIAESEFRHIPSETSKKISYAGKLLPGDVEQDESISEAHTKTEIRMDYTDEIEAGELTGEEILSSELTSHPNLADQTGSIGKDSEKHIGFKKPASEEIKPSEEVIEKHTYYEEIPTKEKIILDEIASHAPEEKVKRKIEGQGEDKVGVASKLAEPEAESTDRIPGKEIESERKFADAIGVESREESTDRPGLKRSVPGKQIESEGKSAEAIRVESQEAESTDRPSLKRSVPGKEIESEGKFSEAIGVESREAESTDQPSLKRSVPGKEIESEGKLAEAIGVESREVDAAEKFLSEEKASVHGEPDIICTESKKVSETGPSPPVKKRVDCSCQSKDQEDQSCQCCECKEVGITTSGDKETTTDEHKIMRHTPEDQTQDSDSEFITISETTEHALAEVPPKQTGDTQGILSAEIQIEQMGDYLPIQESIVIPIEDEEPPEDLQESSRKIREGYDDLLSEHPELIGKSSKEQQEILKNLVYGPSTSKKIKITNEMFDKHPELSGKTSEEQLQIIKNLGYKESDEEIDTKVAVDTEMLRKHPELAGKTSTEQQKILKKLGYMNVDQEKLHKDKQMLKELEFQAPPKDKSHEVIVDKLLVNKHPELAGKSSKEQQKILKELGYKTLEQDTSHKVNVDEKILSKHSKLAEKSSEEEQKILKELGYQPSREEMSHKITIDKNLLEKHPELAEISSEEQQKLLRELGYRAPIQQKPTKIKVDDDILSQHPELVGKSSEQQQKLLKDLGYSASKTEIAQREIQEEFFTPKESKVLDTKQQGDEPSVILKESPKQFAVTQDLLQQYPELDGRSLDEQMVYLRNLGLLPPEILPIDAETLKKHLEGKSLEEQKEILKKLSVSRGVSDQSREYLKQLLLGLVDFPEEEIKTETRIDKSVSCRAICRTQATVYDESPPTQPEDNIGDVVEAPSLDKTQKTSIGRIPTSEKISESCKASCKTINTSAESVSAAKSTEKSRTVSTQERPRSVEESSSCRASNRTISVQGSTPKIKDSGLSPKQYVEELVPARKKESTTSSSSDSKEKGKTKKKRALEEVPSIVSELSDKDLGPPVDRSRGKPRKKRSTLKSLGAIKCDCGDICRCIICSPDVMDRRAGSCVCGGPHNPPNVMTPLMMPPQQQQQMMMMMQQMGYPGYPMIPPMTPAANEHPFGCTCRECICYPCTPCPNIPDGSQRSECSANRKPEKNKKNSSEFSKKPKEEKPVFVPQCDCPGGKDSSTLSPKENQLRCHAKDCECVDCLTMPKIKKLAQTKEYPVVYEEQQVYQVKCDCENAQNARSFLRSRIPVPIRPQSPQMGTDSDRTQQVSTEPSRTQQQDPQANKTAPSGPLQLSTPVVPSAESHISACDCNPCLCEDCADHSIPRRRGSKLLPTEPTVSPSQQVQISPLQPSKLEVSPSQLEPELHPPDCTCGDCIECPGSELMKQQTQPVTPAEILPSQTRSQTVAPSKSPSKSGPPTQTQSKTGPPRQDQSKTGPPGPTQSKAGRPEEFVPCTCDDPCDCPGDKPTPPEGGEGDIPCTCDDPCDCPGEKPIPRKKGSPNVEGAVDVPEECECDTCDCPGLKIAPSAVSGKPSVQTRPPDDHKSPLDEGRPEGDIKDAPMKNIPEALEDVPCDCPDDCKCNPCADPRKRGLYFEPAKCDCVDCKCDPCADPDKVKTHQPTKDSKMKMEGSKVQVEGILHIVEPSVTQSQMGRPTRPPDLEIQTDPMKENVGVNFPEKVLHPTNCDCEECTCLEDIIHTEDSAHQAGEEFVSAKTSEFDKLHPDNCTCDACVCEVPRGVGDQIVRRHSDECICEECVCVAEGMGDQIVGRHSDECVCEDCVCVAEGKPHLMEPSKIMEMGTSTKPMTPKVSTQTHPIDCDCPICYCERGPSIELGIQPTQKESAATTPDDNEKEMETVAVKKSVEPVATESTGILDESDFKFLEEAEIPNKPSAHKQAQNAGDDTQRGRERGDNCTCETCLCIDCAGKQPLESLPPDDTYCHCPTCQCDNCTRQQADKHVSPKPDEKIANDKAVESIVEEESAVDVTDKVLLAKPSVRVDETQVGEPHLMEPSKVKMMEMGTSAKPMTPKVSAQTHPIDCDCPICYCERRPSIEHGTQATPKQSAGTTPDDNRKEIETVAAEKSAGDVAKKGRSGRSGEEITKVMSAKPDEPVATKPTGILDGSSFKLLEGSPCDCKTKHSSCKCPVCSRLNDGPTDENSKTDRVAKSQSQSKAAIEAKSQSKAAHETKSQSKAAPEGSSFKLLSGMPCNCQTSCECPVCPRLEQRSKVGVDTKSSSKAAFTQKSQSAGAAAQKSSVRIQKPSGTQIEELEIGHTPAQGVEAPQEFVDKSTSRTHPVECICDVCVCEIDPQESSVKMDKKSSAKIEKKSSVKVLQSTHDTECTCETCVCTKPEEEKALPELEKAIPEKGKVLDKATSKIHPDECICDVCVCEIEPQTSSVKMEEGEKVISEKEKLVENATSRTHPDECICDVCVCEIEPQKSSVKMDQEKSSVKMEQQISSVKIEKKSSVKTSQSTHGMECPCGTCVCTPNMLGQISTGDGGTVNKEPRSLNKQPSNIAKEASKVEFAKAKTSEIAGLQATNSPATIVHSKPDEVPCDCPVKCECEPCADPNVTQKQPSYAKVAPNIQSNAPVTPQKLSEAKIVQQPTSEAKIKKMPSSTIKQEIEKHVGEKCQCRDEIMEIKKALENIKCSCDEAEMRTLSTGMIYPGQTATGIEAIPAVASHGTHAVASSHVASTSAHISPSTQAASKVISSNAANVVPSSHVASTSAHIPPSAQVTPKAFSSATYAVASSHGVSTSAQNQQGGRMFVKQASDFGQTMSGLKMALQNLQQKCQMKDRMIAAMTGELELRGEDVDYDKVLNNCKILPPMEYDLADDIKSNDRSQLVSNIVIQVDNKDQGTEPIRNVSSKAVEVRTHKHRKKCSERCDHAMACNMHPIIQKDEINCQQLDLKGFEVIDVRRITEDSLIIKWMAPGFEWIAGYDIFINGTLASKVMSGSRTSAMIHSLDLKKSVQITIYAVTKCGRCEPPAIAIYEIKS